MIEHYLKYNYILLAENIIKIVLTGSVYTHTTCILVIIIIS